MRSLWGVPTGRSVWMVFVAIFVSVIAAAAAVRVVGASPAPPALNVTPTRQSQRRPDRFCVGGAEQLLHPACRASTFSNAADPGGSVGQSAQGHHHVRRKHHSGRHDSGRCRRELFRGRRTPSSCCPVPHWASNRTYKPICNQTNSCVLYVGQNQNDFTAPKVFSAPFLICSSSGTPTTTAAGCDRCQYQLDWSAETRVRRRGRRRPGPLSARRPRPPRVRRRRPPVLRVRWRTPVRPAELAWVVASGMTLLLTGAVGRRLVLRRAR